MTLPVSAQSKVRTEFIDAGLSLGIMTIEDFPSEFTWGLSLTFQATEDFFLQVNYDQASDVSLSSAEQSQGELGTQGESRDFVHYDLLLGFNLFHGEFFNQSNSADLSSLYLVAGVGETEFIGESRFTYTLGIGYQVALKRDYIVRFDVRDYIYKSSLIQEDNTTNNLRFSAGFSYFF